MRGRLRGVRRVRVTACAKSNYFGECVESLLFAAWLTAQAGRDEESIEYRFERSAEGETGSVASVEIAFDDGTTASIARDRERGVLVANVGGEVTVPESVTRTQQQRTDDLIVRQLKRTARDGVLVKTLSVAAKLAKRL